MADRDMDRERRGRQTDDDADWDWYYYEYRYDPYYSAGNYDYSRYYGRGYGQEYGRPSGRGYAPDYGRPYGRYYGRVQDYEDDFSSYGVTGHWPRGRYSGMGPRGYHRSDERIQEDVNDRLTWHGLIDATDVGVEVKDGVVTLSGDVNSRQEKRLAEDIAESVPGVVDVENRLKINRQRQGETTEVSSKKRS